MELEIANRVLRDLLLPEIDQYNPRYVAPEIISQCGKQLRKEGS